MRGSSFFSWERNVMLFFGREGKKFFELHPGDIHGERQNYAFLACQGRRKNRYRSRSLIIKYKCCAFEQLKGAQQAEPRGWGPASQPTSQPASQTDRQKERKLRLWHSSWNLWSSDTPYVGSISTTLGVMDILTDRQTHKEFFKGYLQIHSPEGE